MRGLPDLPGIFWSSSPRLPYDRELFAREYPVDIQDDYERVVVVPDALYELGIELRADFRRRLDLFRRELEDLLDGIGKRSDGRRLAVALPRTFITPRMNSGVFGTFVMGIISSISRTLETSTAKTSSASLNVRYWFASLTAATLITASYIYDPVNASPNPCPALR
jgi:hypothetical protein